MGMQIGGEGPSQSRMARPAVQRQFTHREILKGVPDGQSKENDDCNGKWK